MVHLTLGDIQSIVRMGRSTICRHIEAGQFPAPMKIGTESIHWHRKEIEQWIASLPCAGQREGELL